MFFPHPGILSMCSDILHDEQVMHQIDKLVWNIFQNIQIQIQESVSWTWISISQPKYLNSEVNASNDIKHKISRVDWNTFLWDTNKTKWCNGFYIEFRQNFAKETFSYDEQLKS